MSSQDFSSIENHIVILGWSTRVPRIIEQLRNDVHRASNEIRPILVVIEDYQEQIRESYEHVYYVYGRLNDPQVLQRANLEKAHTVLIPTSLSEMQAADGESVFHLMAVLAVNPNVRVCVELASAEGAEALDHIRRNNLRSGDIEIVSFESLAEKLMAQAAINKGVTRIYDHLLTFDPETNEIYVVQLGPRWAGATFRALSAECFERHVIVLGIERGVELLINPADREMVLQAGDAVWYVALNKAAGIELINPALLHGK